MTTEKVTYKRIKSSAFKKVRKSKNGAVEYQIEYQPTQDAKHFEYRVRRGAKGSWTQWFKTTDIKMLLMVLGFYRKRPTWSNDFHFEAYFGRGEIRLNRNMVKWLATTAGYQTQMNTYLYARLKQVERNVWVLPAASINTKKLFNHLRDIIQSHS